MARRVPILIAALFLLALGYFLFRGRDAIGPEHGSAPGETAEATSTPRIERVAEPVRESAAAPAVEANSSSVLAVFVVAKEDHRPLAAIRLTVFPKDPKPGSSSRDVDGNRGTIETGPRTDAEGRAEFDLPSRVDLRISARSEDSSTGSAHLDLSGLEPGIRRELTVELLTKNDVVFHGRVLAREVRHPIATATIHVESPARGLHVSNGRIELGPSITAPHDVQADADGRFELELASWMAPWARIAAEDFAAAFVAPRSGHETRETEQEILLDRGATLKIHLLGPNGLRLVEARVQALTESDYVQQPRGAALDVATSIPDPNWTADADADGRCTLNELPPGAPLHVEALQGSKSLRKEAEPITLRPGEVRELEWQIGGGCRLSGRVTDSRNLAVVGQEIWVLDAETGKDEYLESYAERRVVKRTKTDEEGRYHVDDLSAGHLVVGPAPLRKYIGPVRADAVAPLAVVVEIPEGVSELKRDLVVYRGLYIRGHVLDSRGAPAARAAVGASTDEMTLRVVANGQDDGSFTLGPLGPGHFQLKATGVQQLTWSDPVTASAGDEGVILQLAAAGSLAGSVVDASTGLSSRAQVTVSSRDPSIAISTWENTKEDGSFKFDGLRTGTYDVSAFTEDGRAGSIHGVAVVADVAAAASVVQIARGAKVTVRYQGKAPMGYFQVESEKVSFGGDGLRSGTSDTRVVPAGHVIVKFRLWNPTREQEKELDISVGEEKQVEFTDGG